MEALIKSFFDMMRHVAVCLCWAATYTAVAEPVGKQPLVFTLFGKDAAHRVGREKLEAAFRNVVELSVSAVLLGNWKSSLGKTYGQPG